jgi:hypothetical protein
MTEQHRKLTVFGATLVCQIIVNTPRLANLKRKREYSIDMRKASIRNHRVGLQQAGILVDYLFRGHKSAVKMNI